MTGDLRDDVTVDDVRVDDVTVDDVRVDDVRVDGVTVDDVAAVSKRKTVGAAGTRTDMKNTKETVSHCYNSCEMFV